LGAARYVVVANIPYYITSALIRHLLEAEHKPTRMVLTVQQEVAERILARDGKMSLLALSVQVYGKPELRARIPAGCFYPPPKVDSAVLSIGIYQQARIPSESLDLFFKLAHAGFGQKRKTLRNSLATGMKKSPAWAEQLLGAAGIDPQRRAETLSLVEWKQLVEAYNELS
jgi:16S rRNA (adenine1518-N6/adenine1519-N6)-dimethyltransferase